MKHTRRIQTASVKLNDDLARDKSESLLATLVRWCEDPLRPRTEQGNFRPSPTLVLIGVLFTLSVLTFVGFSLVRQ